MSNRIIYLTESEEIAIRLMSKGRQTFHLKERNLIPASGMGWFTTEIRRKTGICDTRNPKQCLEYLEKYETAMAGPGLTPQQVTLFEKILEYGIAEHGMLAHRLSSFEFQIEPKEIPQMIDDACAAAGITTWDSRARRVQIRIYLATFCVRTKFEDLSTIKKRILKLIAEGFSYDAISVTMGERVEFIRSEARSVCLQLGLTARGKGTQRAIVKAYMDALEGKKTEAEPTPSEPVTMDDPMF